MHVCDWLQSLSRSSSRQISARRAVWPRKVNNASEASELDAHLLRRHTPPSTWHLSHQQGRRDGRRLDARPSSKTLRIMAVMPWKESKRPLKTTSSAQRQREAHASLRPPEQRGGKQSRLKSRYQQRNLGHESHVQLTLLSSLRRSSTQRLLCNHRPFRPRKSDRLGSLVRALQPQARGGRLMHLQLSVCLRQSRQQHRSPQQVLSATSQSKRLMARRPYCRAKLSS